jgi:integrase
VRGEKLLTATQVRNLKKPGKYSDGGGLYLVVSPSGARKWILRKVVDGRRRDFGLGSANEVPLAEVRETAAEYRRLIRLGNDPVAEKKKAKDRHPTFREAAERVHQENAPTWKNAKHAAQWINTLKAYVFPDFGDTYVSQIDGPAVHAVLLKIWLEKPETARRVRQRIGTVLDWAHAKGFRPYPLDLRGLSRGLPKQPKGVKHHAAMPYEDVSAFIGDLREMVHISPSARLAMEFLILTAARTGEVRGAKWSEIDLETKVWTVPADRMKAGKAHMVPLCDRAVSILGEAEDLKRGAAVDKLIFPGTTADRPLSNMTLAMILRREGLDATPHGFRSSFRDWAAEKTYMPREVAEAALAHTVENKVEAAYRRTQYLDQRRELMEAWGQFCEAKITGNLVSMMGR